MGQLHFELVSPEKVLISQPVTMVTVPGGEGDYGVLEGHSPMITTVRAGVITIYAENDVTVTEKIFVARGFAEVNGDRCTVLAEEAIPVAELDRPSIDLQIKLLTETLATALTDADRIKHQAELAVAEAKLLVAPAA